MCLQEKFPEFEQIDTNKMLAGRFESIMHKVLLQRKDEALSDDGESKVSGDETSERTNAGTGQNEGHHSVWKQVSEPVSAVQVFKGRAECARE